MILEIKCLNLFQRAFTVRCMISGYFFLKITQDLKVYKDNTKLNTKDNHECSCFLRFKN